MHKHILHQIQSRRRVQLSEPQKRKKQPPRPEVSDAELDRRALEMLERPKTKGAGQ